MDKRTVDIRTSIPELTELQDLIDKHRHLMYELEINIRKIYGLSLNINLEMKDTEH